MADKHQMRLPAEADLKMGRAAACIMSGLPGPLATVDPQGPLLVSGPAPSALFACLAKSCGDLRMVRLAGIEPATSGSTIRRSNQLSYNRTGHAANNPTPPRGGG